MNKTVRIDKWLWAVRLFKTRSKATQACKKGNVKINGQPAKPAADIKPGDLLHLKKDHLNLQVKVVELLEKRVGAKIAAEYMEDQTPQQEYHKKENAEHTNYEYRERGLGRPSKKQRREIEKLKRFLK
ncbi:MAG: RNA-binding S4 domain-containing protein [Bacteroidales bacterium]